MPEEVCHCGFQVPVDQYSYYVDGAPCCTRHCYNKAVKRSAPLDRDGYMWGGPRKEVQE